ncbi:tRNA/rRNA methyltransferase [Alkalimonas amylolytica]|uniref:RNA methyltransferase, TrmH family n=1 Tax=Alkalimonas amylolytica TaxID=152573 RepID=A0A1H4CGN7_ALKAM|nr:tRNA/rRNA methyltransferase [Alkalimonas amylolytica]SEA59500.1 RNA methyltransferase, TrmH family [Alkalimonas amylolytica]
MSGAPSSKRPSARPARAKNAKPWADKSSKQASPKAKRPSQPAAARTAKAAPERAPSPRAAEQKIYGEKACQVLFARRPEAIIRLYLNAEQAPKCAAMMKYLAKAKKAYHLVEDAELDKLAASQHHGGIVMLVQQPESLPLHRYLRQQKDANSDLILAMDGVSNPHNLGAIARTCAHFGVKAILLPEAQLLYSGASVRTAAGGAEFVQAVHCEKLPEALLLCRQAGYQLMSTSSHKGESLYQATLPAKAVMVFGEEMFGVSKAVAQKADTLLRIPGTDQVESLNVSVAAALIIGEWYRQHGG